MKLRRRYFLLYKTITSRKMLYCLFQSCLLNFYSFRFWSPKDNRQRSMQTKFLDIRRSLGFVLRISNPPLFTPPTSPRQIAAPHAFSRPPTPHLPPPPPTPSTTANNSVITDFFPPTAGDSANLLIKDPITMGSVWTDYNRSRNTAVLILEDSCLGASQTGPSPPLKVGMNHKAPRPPHLHRAHSVQQAGKNGWPRRCFSLYNYRPEDGRGGARAVGAGWRWLFAHFRRLWGLHILLNLSDLFFLSLSVSSLFSLSLPSAQPFSSFLFASLFPDSARTLPPSPSPLAFPLFPPMQH